MVMETSTSTKVKPGKRHSACSGVPRGNSSFSLSGRLTAVPGVPFGEQKVFGRDPVVRLASRQGCQDRSGRPIWTCRNVSDAPVVFTPPSTAGHRSAFSTVFVWEC